jgi:hypothetical protein
MANQAEVAVSAERAGGAHGSPTGLMPRDHHHHVRPRRRPGRTANGGLPAPRCQARRRVATAVVRWSLL